MSCLVQVSLSTYDGDESHLLNWGEFLAFLGGRRNPYVTVSLFPKAEKPGASNKGLSESDEAEEDLQVGLVDSEGGSNPK